MQERAMANEKIEFLWNTVVTEVKGDGTGVVGVDLLISRLKSDGIFRLPVISVQSGINRTPISSKGF